MRFNDNTPMTLELVRKSVEYLQNERKHRKLTQTEEKELMQDLIYLEEVDKKNAEKSDAST